MQVFFEIQTESEWQRNCSDFEWCFNSSLMLLDTVKYSSVSYVVFGILAFTLSFPVILTISFSRNLWNKSFLLIANLAVWDLLMSSAFIYKGANRLYHLYVNSPELMSQFQCLLEETMLILSLGGNIVVFFLTALDRLMSIMFPTWYMLKYPNWFYINIYAVGYIYLFIELASLYQYSDDTLYIPICSYPTVSQMQALQHQGHRMKALVGATIVIYILNIFLIYHQLKLAKGKGLSLSVTRKKLQVRVLITLLLILLSFALTIALAHVLHSVALVQKDFKLSLTLATFCGVFVCVNGISNFPILYCRSKSFKIATKNVFNCICVTNNNTRTIHGRNRRLTNYDMC